MPGTQPLGSMLERAEAVACRRENHECRDGRDRDEREGPWQRQQLADVRKQSSRWRWWQDDHAREPTCDLNGSGHHGAGRRIARGGDRHGASERGSHLTLDVAAQRLRRCRHESSIGHDHVDRWAGARSACEQRREIAIGFLRQRSADLRGDGGRCCVGVARRECACRSRVADHEALRDEHHDHGDDEADPDPPIEAAIPADQPWGCHDPSMMHTKCCRSMGGAGVASRNRFMVLTKFPNICARE
jgi:hypothetical protein